MQPDPVAFEVSRGIIHADIIKRKSEQSANFMSIVWLLFGLGIFFLWGWALNATSKQAQIKQDARATRQAELASGIYSGGSEGIDFAGTPTTTSTPALPTVTPPPSPTATPSATPTPIYSVYYVFKYSYYNPRLGGVNCFLWDAALNDCLSMMANGEDWRLYYGQAVACPPEIALGTVVEVLFPDALAGYWICKDRGGLIVDNWIDFLDIAQRAEWGEPVATRLFPPVVPLEQVTNGSH